MIIMALDHTRDFFHATAMTADPLDLKTTSVALFFTRWITHFCAPVFVFLSGLSAYLSSKSKSRSEASGFLIKRGLWLVVVEIVIVTLGLTFNPFYNFIILQVIWAIGLSMILLGILSAISYRLVLVVGILLFFGHNAFDYASLPQDGVQGYLWKIFFTSRGAVIPINNTHLIGAFYAVLPWTGIMLTGFSLGRWFTKEVSPELRRQRLLIAGSSLLLIFIILRLLRGYGDPGAYQSAVNPFLSFLDTSKYPPSLQYAGMTLGPALILLAFTENIQNRFSSFVTVYGRVPFFYYIMHFYILHTLLVIAFFLTGHSTGEIADPNIPFLFRPVNFGFGLPGTYAVWAAVVLVLYYPCRWFYRYKTTHSQWWLKYL